MENKKSYFLNFFQAKICFAARAKFTNFKVFKVKVLSIFDLLHFKLLESAPKVPGAWYLGHTTWGTPPGAHHLGSTLGLDPGGQGMIPRRFKQRKNFGDTRSRTDRWTARSDSRNSDVDATR